LKERRKGAMKDQEKRKEVVILITEREIVNGKEE